MYRSSKIGGKSIRGGMFDHIFIAKVFDFTKISDGILDLPNVSYGGTGFQSGFHAYPTRGNPSSANSIEDAGFVPALPDEIEQIK